MESERKYVERLAVEDFGSTHVGKVHHCSRFLDFLSLVKRKMDLNHSTCIYLDTKTNNDKNDGVLQARKYLWNLTEYPETSVWARVG